MRVLILQIDGRMVASMLRDYGRESVRRAVTKTVKTPRIGRRRRSGRARQGAAARICLTPDS